MRSKLIILFLLFFSSSFNHALGQLQVVDSLENLLREESDTNQKLSILNELAARLNGIDVDKSRIRAQEALALANRLGNQHEIAVAYIHIGSFFGVKGLYDSAFFYHQSALDIGQKNKDLLVQAQALMHIGKTHRYQSDYATALKYLEQGLQIARQINDSYWEAFALNIMGLIYQQQGNYTLSLEVSEKALAMRQTMGLKVDIAASLGNIGLVYDYMGDFPKALDYYFRALKMNEEIGFTSGVATAWNNIGIVYSFMGKSDDALKAFQAAYKYHEKSGNKRFMAGTLDNIGLNYHDRGQYVKALEIYLQTLTIREEINDKQGITTSYKNIGDIYILQGNASLAMEYYTKALVIGEDIGNKYGVADSHQALGSIHYELAQYDTALSHYQEALNIRNEIGNKGGIASSLITIGAIHLIKKEFEQAKQVFQKALNLALEIGEKSKEINGLKGLANAYIGFREYDKALHYANQAMTRLEHSENRYARQQMFRTLAEIHENLGQFQKAYKNHLAYAQLKDSLLNEETTQQLTEMQVKFDTERKERLISEQEFEINLLEASNKYRQRLIWAGTIALLSLFGIVFTYRSRKYAIREKEMQESFSQQLIASFEDERKRISMDLHDSVGQSLMLIKNKVVLDQDQSTVNMVSKALEEVRSISKALHPVLLDKLGLTASIKKIIKEFDEQTEIFFAEEIDNIDGIFTKENELQIFRILQEALNNLVKHAESPSALIKINNLASSVELLIQDYGKGFDVLSGDFNKSLGMKTLKERTQILGGKIMITSVKDEGTSIVLKLFKSS